VKHRGFSLDQNSEGVMEITVIKLKTYELACVKWRKLEKGWISRGWQNEPGSWFQR